MVGFIILVFTSFLFLSFYYKSVDAFVKLAFITAISLQFLLARIGFDYTNLVFVFLFSIFIILVILNIKRLAVIKEFKKVLVCQAAFIVYIVLTSTIRGDFFTMLDSTKFYFFALLLIPLIVSIKNELTFQNVNKFIVICTLLLGFLGILQFLIPTSFHFFVIDLSQFGFNAVEDISINRRVVGLALSPTNYGNLMTFLLLYVIGVRESINIPKYLLRAGIIMVIISVIITGIKTSLATLLVGIFILGILKKDKKLIKIITISCLALFFFWNIIIEIGSGYSHEESFSNPIGRSLRLFSLVNSNAVGEESTLELTVRALNDFLEAPIIGSGDRMNWLRQYSLTDAYLLFHLVQYGIIGISIILYPYFKFLNRIKDKSGFAIILTLFIVVILQTLTDTGLFYAPVNMVFCILIGLQLKESLPSYKFRNSPINDYRLKNISNK